VAKKTGQANFLGLIILKLYDKQKEVGEIKFKDEEKFLLACHFAQIWRDRDPQKNDFNISFECSEIS
jgi:hypothetical protein